MNFEEFENMARMAEVGALEPDELRVFEEARELFGERAEVCIKECQKLNAAFALSLRPQPPPSVTKARLMALVKASLDRREASPGPERPPQ
jgi:hypothetical protein